MEAVNNGFNVSNMFSNMLNGVTEKGSGLTKQMDALSTGKDLTSEQLVAIQFQVGQYNTMMEALATVTKSMTDMMKSLAQRAN